ncbi:MAG: gliding motility-associated C-terminal domain-containing protein, partial [Cruoricaptor ignavus]|nr:gliding motility-associated C-terminal domain-containing protein [Cruoricaptor ignavus]
GYCPASVKEIQLKTNPKIPLNSVSPIEICDNLLANSVEINLGDYQNLFTNSATATFYETLANAQNKTNPINFNQNISANKTFYLRFENATDCPNISELSFVFKQPKKSETLTNKTICENATTTLDAGTGFDSYLWSNGETSSAITVGVGAYFVDLASNGCVYRQYVNVTTSEKPVINSVIVEGSTVTINASGGTGTYLYSINGTDWFANPQFYNVARGTHSAFVKDTNECAIVEEPFIIINLINAITPNNDGVNDVLDYSDLKIKTNVSLEIYDRYGKRVYESQNDNFIWNGTSGGRTVPSGTYWYILKWTEPATGEQKLYTNWILVKNR